MERIQDDGWRRRPAVMRKSLSFDLGARVLAAVDEGLSCRQAAARFGVSASSAIRWLALRRLGGDARPRPQGGDRLSRRTERHGDLTRSLLAETPDVTLPELKARLAQSGAQASVAALWRFCKRHKLTRKKRQRRQASRIGPTC
jgi:transposase